MSDFIVECPCCGESFTANRESGALRARVAELGRSDLLLLQTVSAKNHAIRTVEAERDAAIKERDEARAELNEMKRQ